MIKFADGEYVERDERFLELCKVAGLNRAESAELLAKETGRVVELVHSESLGRPDLSYDQFDMPEKDSDILAAEA